MKISLAKKRILLLLTFLWAIGILFVPIRKDEVKGYYHGNTPETQTFTKADEVHECSLAIGFNGSPGGIGGIFFFALMPFFVTWESFSFKRPFSLPGKAFLQLQALLLFLGGPYCYYMITYQEGNFYDTVHETNLSWGGYILVFQNILLAAFLFSAVANQKGWTAQFFGERNTQQQRQ
jgi:hypothetical protein